MKKKKFLSTWVRTAFLWLTLTRQCCKILQFCDPRAENGPYYLLARLSISLKSNS